MRNKYVLFKPPHLWQLLWQAHRQHVSSVKRLAPRKSVNWFIYSCQSDGGLEAAVDNSLLRVRRAVLQGEEKKIKLISYQKPLGKQISRINTCYTGLWGMTKCDLRCLRGPECSTGKEGWWLSKETACHSYPGCPLSCTSLSPDFSPGEQASLARVFFRRPIYTSGGNVKCTAAWENSCAVSYKTNIYL